MAKRFIAPFILYLAGATIVSYVPDLYPLAYAIMVMIVGGVTWFLLRGPAVFVPHWRVGAGILVGLAGIALWIGISELKLETRIAMYLPEWLQPAERVAYNPFQELEHPAAIWGFITFRLIGLVALVPVAEELFWRGFLLRWLISPEWEQVPLGKFTLVSFLLVVAMFSLAHPEWLAAAVYCALLNGLLYWKKDLWICIVAHAVSNLLLALYVLANGAWWLW